MIRELSRILRPAVPALLLALLLGLLLTACGNWQIPTRAPAR